MNRGNPDRATEERQPTPAQWRRLIPAVGLPVRSGLRRLCEQDRQLLEQCLSQTCDCLYHPSFRAAAYRRLTPATAAKVPENAGQGALSRADERMLFMRFNYCRHRVMRVLRAHRRRRLPLSAARELLAWQQAADSLRSCLVDSNVALVKAMARRFGRRSVELSELVSEGNLTLVRCVDKFDAARGYKFSTYACRAMLASFTRMAARRTRQRTLTPVSYAPALDPSDHLERQREQNERDIVEELREIIAGNAARLTNTEQRVLSARFALQSLNGGRRNGSGWTLHRIGASLGISKERVRQIQCRALGKLRAVLNERLAPAV
jgi:RNA polymerase primary sigma factor